MADAKITALTELTAVDNSDLLAIVDDPSGSPITKKITVDNLTANTIKKAFMAAKGDLIGASADDTPSILSVGTDGQVLTADSGETTGLAWTDTGSTSMTRQAIINGNFDIWQRGTSGTPLNATNVFTTDRWADYITIDGGTLPTLTRSRQAVTPGDIDGAFYCTRLAFDGAGTSFGTGSRHLYNHNIEHGTRYLCGDGKTVTVSFWARSDVADKRLAVTLYQGYGTGGSPSATETILNSVTPVTLTSSWTKYTYTFTTNTLSGKTFGTSNNDSFAVRFHYMWGTTLGNTEVYPSVTAEDFGGAGYIDIAQVQLCAGDVALPFMPKSFEDELRACQRYAYVLYASTGTSPQWFHGQATSTTNLNSQIIFPTTMRIQPTPTFSSGTGKILISCAGSFPAVTAISFNGNGNQGKLSFSTAGSLTADKSGFVYVNVADPDYIVFSAEL